MPMILKTAWPLYAKANGPLIRNGTMNVTNGASEQKSMTMEELSRIKSTEDWASA